MNNALLPSTLYQIIDQDISFIDLRDSHQYLQLHIKNFINIPPSHLKDYILSLPQNKPICLICYSGKSAKEYADLLCSQGYQAYYIKGGFQAFLNLQNNEYY